MPQPTHRFQGFGPFGSFLVTIAAGLLAGCLTLFVSIFALLAYNTLGHHHTDYALTYKFFALPAGVATAFATALTLSAVALRRRFRH